MTDISGLVITADITEQVKSIEDKKKDWLSEKADTLLASENKKELVINLIEDFNMAYGGCKQIERVAKEGVSRKTSSGLRSALVEIIQYFDPEYQHKD